MNSETSPLPAEPIVVRGLSNREFLERHARAGRIGLSAGPTLADRMIVRAERRLEGAGGRGSWSHAFLFFYCSALVQHLFRQAGLDLAPGLHTKNTTPDDLARSPATHTTWVLQQQVPRSRLALLAGRVRRLRRRATKT